MQISAEHGSNRSLSGTPDQISLESSAAAHSAHTDYKIIRRNGAVVALTFT